MVFALACLNVQSQTPTLNRNNDTKNTYRATVPKINDLVHTKLEVRFDFNKSYLYGKAWITLKPHFYKTDSVRLDAKGMNINKVGLIANGKLKELSYDYDSLNLNIKLDKSYLSKESYTLYIDYTAKPNEFSVNGSKAITDAKGLYFINPLGKDKNKPTEIWTQGETEASSVWFPTIDNTNQKTTQEIFMTVPAKYVTLSNGLLVSKKKNADGTRTDYWKMDLPHAPYLFFMGVGDFAVVKDRYKGKEVSYYVEKDYEKVARRIFGLTPEMMGYFSRILGVEYPWAKYSQMVARDFVSGAMENTTATLHSEYLQQNARQLSDGNKYEDYISHELFHQWFGNLVTAESWSNLTLNESFASYSEVLWREYKYGKDDAEAHGFNELLTYLYSGGSNKDLVRFNYNDKEDMFDVVSYQKGGRILNMLRNYVGDSAFFKSLNLYLTTNKFKSAEVHQLRLAFEEVTGQDLNWFFNQWYFGSGHPQLDITYGYDSIAQKAHVFIKQIQEGNPFKLPIAIDVYNNGNSTRHNVWVENKTDTFSFASPSKPGLINVDADKILVAEKQDNKSLKNYVEQYKYAKNYVDKREAVDYAMVHLDKPGAQTLLTDALNDPYYGIREIALAGFAEDTSAISKQALAKIETIANKDEKRTTRAAAINVLGQYNNQIYQPIFVAGVSDSSYTVAARSLMALAAVNERAANALLPTLKKDAKGLLNKAIEQVELMGKGDADFDELTEKFDAISTYEKLTAYNWYLMYLRNVTNTKNFKSGVDRIVKFRDIVGGYSVKYKNKINDQLRSIASYKLEHKTNENAVAIQEQAAYIEEKIK